LPRWGAGRARLAAGGDERRRVRNPPPGEPAGALRTDPAGLAGQPGPQLGCRGAGSGGGHGPSVAALHGRVRARLRTQSGATAPDPRGEARRDRGADAAAPRLRTAAALTAVHSRGISVAEPGMMSPWLRPMTTGTTPPSPSTSSTRMCAPTAE